MRDLNYIELIEDIANWIKQYVQTANLNGVVVGLSGGIDSAVTTSLCIKGFGKENIIGVGLPCESISQDLDDARLVAKSLGIDFEIVDLTLTYKEMIKNFPSEITLKDMALANIKPRLRMITLYCIAQSLGYLVGGTGNRTELAIGYFTKYGDIGDLCAFLH